MELVDEMWLWSIQMPTKIGPKRHPTTGQDPGQVDSEGLPR